MYAGSLQSRNINTTTTIPLSKILRPIPPVLDNAKIESMVRTLTDYNSKTTPEISKIPGSQADLHEAEASKSNHHHHPDLLPPVDVLYYKPDSGRDYYFAFGGCHRLQAYEKAGVENVPCKILKVTKSMLKVYLGSSVDVIVGEKE